MSWIIQLFSDGAHLYPPRFLLCNKGSNKVLLCPDSRERTWDSRPSRERDRSCVPLNGLDSDRPSPLGKRTSPPVSRCSQMCSQKRRVSSWEGPKQLTTRKPNSTPHSINDHRLTSCQVTALALERRSRFDRQQNAQHHQWGVIG